MAQQAQQSEILASDAALGTGTSVADRARDNALERGRLRATPGFYKRAWRRLRRDKVAMVGLVIVVLMVLFSLSAGLISEYVTGYSYSQNNLRMTLRAPGEDGYILGTDGNGRDILTRLAYGGRVSLRVAALAAMATLVIGAAVGSAAGFFGGFIDSILMRLVDVLLALPGLSLLILITALYKPGPILLAFVIAALGWAGISRLIRGEVLALRHREYVEAARLLGSSNTRIITRHILPNVMPIVIVWLSLAIPGLILTEATLSFLGLGVQVPIPSWGNMLQEAKDNYTKSWTGVFIPGFAIFITSLAINLLGNGLRDALDPRLNN